MSVIKAPKQLTMDFLKAEIERKRKMMEEAKVLKTSSGPTANKYFKRGELLKKQVCIAVSFSSLRMRE